MEEYAFKKWGGPEGLDAEYERRESQKKEKKDKKFKEKLAGKTTTATITNGYSLKVDGD